MAAAYFTFKWKQKAGKANTYEKNVICPPSEVQKHRDFDIAAGLNNKVPLVIIKSNFHNIHFKENREFCKALSLYHEVEKFLEKSVAPSVTKCGLQRKKRLHEFLYQLSRYT